MYGHAGHHRDREFDGLEDRLDEPGLHGQQTQVDEIDEQQETQDDAKGAGGERRPRPDPLHRAHRRADRSQDREPGKLAFDGYRVINEKRSVPAVFFQGCHAPLSGLIFGELESDVVDDGVLCPGSALSGDTAATKNDSPVSSLSPPRLPGAQRGPHSTSVRVGTNQHERCSPTGCGHPTNGHPDVAWPAKNAATLRFQASA
jgi:hypothetical protein